MVKEILFQLFHLITDAIMHFPSGSVRTLYARTVFKEFGKGSQIARHAHFIAPYRISIGRNVVVNRNATLDGRNGLVIEDNVDIGEFCSIWSMQHNPHDENHATTGGTTVIKDHAWIAPHSIILPGCVVERGCVIGTASVLTHSAPAMSIMAGAPAKKIGDRKNSCKYELKYKFYF